jgi:hypothetical protein
MRTAFKSMQIMTIIISLDVFAADIAIASRMSAFEGP